MLGLDVDELGVRLARRDERRELLDDRRLRRDRLHGHDVGLDLPHCVRDGFAAGEEERAGHSVVSSGTIVIAPVGQTSAQISQPLQ